MTKLGRIFTFQVPTPMVRSLIKLGAIVLAAGIILGSCISGGVYDAATYHDPDLIRIPSATIPEFEIATIAFFVALFETQALVRFCAVSSKVLWISVLLSVVIAVPVALVAAAGSVDTFPPETARLLVISVVFALIGLSVGAGFAKRPY